MKIIEEHRNPFCLTTDPARVDFTAVHDFLSLHSGWSNGIPRAVFEKSLQHSLNFSIFKCDCEPTLQIAFARIISDFATIAYLGDVYVLPDYRGLGLARWLMDSIHAHPELQGLRRWILLTSTASGLYEKYGWTAVAKPELYMEKYNPQIYQQR